MVQAMDLREIKGAIDSTRDVSGSYRRSDEWYKGWMVQSFEYLNIDSWSEVAYFQNVSKL